MTDITETTERTVKGLAGLGTAKVLSQAVSWVVSVAIARVLDPTDYGLMALGVFSVNLFAFVSEFGLGSALVQRDELDERDVHTSFWVMGGANIVLLVLVAMVAHPIAAYYSTPRLGFVIQVLALQFLISSVEMVPSVLLTRTLKFEALAKAEFFGSVVSSIAMLALAYGGFGVWSLVLGWLLKGAVSAGLVLIYQPWRPRAVFQPRRITGMFRFGVTVNGAKLLAYVSNNFDNLIVGKILGSQALGLYNLAFTIGSLPTQKAGLILHRITFPVMARLQSDRQASRRYFLTGTRLVALVATPVSIGMALVADDFVMSVLGARWAPMIFPLRVLSCLGALRALHMFLPVVLIARDRAQILFRYALAQVAVLPAAFYIGSGGGIEGVALAWLVVYPPLFAYLFVKVLRELEIPYTTYVGNLRTVAIATLGMIGSVVTVRAGLADGAGRLAASCVVGAVTYLPLAIVLDRTLLGHLRSAGDLLVTRRTPLMSGARGAAESEVTPEKFAAAKSED